MNKNLIVLNSKIIIGLSGGADSVYLLYQLAKLQDEKKLTLYAVHLDHEWRKESHLDAAFCAELCKDLNITFITKKASELDFIPQKNGSKEDIGRQLRRYFFEKIRKDYNADAIALAHHQDDQLETFFIRLSRGSSLEGLCGIKEKTDYYIRPLLNISKNEILDFFKKNNYSYKEDFTNSSYNYLRNRIRHKALPALQECDDRFAKKCLESITQLQNAETFLKDYVDKIYTDITYYDSKQNVLILDTKKLLILNLYIQKRIIQKWLIEHSVSFSSSNNFLNEIIRFIQSKNGGSHQLAKSWKIIKKQSKIFIQFFAFYNSSL